eukprot:3299457-Ditylum_brightwellii.AAC.1
METLPHGALSPALVPTSIQHSTICQTSKGFCYSVYHYCYYCNNRTETQIPNIAPKPDAQ